MQQLTSILWQTSSQFLDAGTIQRTSVAKAYLDSIGYQMDSVKNDGHCYFHAFLGSYQKHPPIPLLESALDPIDFLRARAGQLGTHWVSADEGGVLAKELGVAIRVVTAGTTSCTDQLYLPDGSLPIDWNIAQWNAPFIFIVDLGHHFVYAHKKRVTDWEQRDYFKKQLALIEEETGSRKEEISALVQGLKAHNESQANALEELEQSFEDEVTRYDTVFHSFLRLFNEFETVQKAVESFISEASASYDYLEYGTGQFEEFEQIPHEEKEELETYSEEIGEPLTATFLELINSKGWEFDLQEELCDSIEEQTSQLTTESSFKTWAKNYLIYRRASIEFRRHIARKYFIEAVDEHPLYSFETLTDDYSALRQLVQTFSSLSIPEEIPEMVILAYDLFEAARKLSYSVEELISAVEGEIEECKPESISDPYDPFRAETLEAENTRFHDFYSHIQELFPVLANLEDKVEELEALKAEMNAVNEDKETIEKNLIHRLKKLQKKLLPIPAEMESVPAQILPKKVLDQLEKVLRLIRKERLLRKAPEEALQALYLRKARLKIHSIDDYLELVRIERAIASLENKLEESRKKVALLFQQKVGFLNPHYLYRLRDEELFTVATNFSHPFLTPLSLMISELSMRHIGTSHYGTFVVPQAGFSAFEQGIFKVLRKNLPGFIISHPANQGEEVHMSHEMLPTHLPHFLSRFSIASVEKSEGIMTEKTRALFSLLALYLAYLFTNDDYGLPEGNPIACLIVSKEGQMLSWGVNTASQTSIHHAEVNALLSYFLEHPGQSFLPEGAQIFTSLKPCHMCAGAIYDAGLKMHPDMVVHFGMNDPAQNHTLIESSLIKSDHPLFEELDRAYEALKKEDKSINAATSLKHLKAHFESIEKAFYALLEDPENAPFKEMILSFFELFED